MSKTEITSAIERTIEEAREYQRQNPDDNTLAIMHMDEYRRSLEARLDYHDAMHPGSLRTIAISIIAPLSFVAAPAIILGGLAYIGGREIYERIKK